MKPYSSPDSGGFWRNYLDKSYNEGRMTKEMYDAHMKLHEESLINSEKRMNEDPESNLERDLRNSEYIRGQCHNSEQYCKDLYAALCNNRFFYGDKEWACSWRHAGGIVADILEKGDYIDWYCSGGEGHATDDIRFDLAQLGWTIKPYEDDDLK